MLTVDNFGRIRWAHRQGMSIRGIAQNFRNSRRSVRNSIRRAEPTPYTLKVDRPVPKLGAFRALIDQLLADDEQAPRPGGVVRRGAGRRVESGLETPAGPDGFGHLIVDGEDGVLVRARHARTDRGRRSAPAPDAVPFRHHPLSFPATGCRTAPAPGGPWD